MPDNMASEMKFEPIRYDYRNLIYQINIKHESLGILLFLTNRLPPKCFERPDIFKLGVMVFSISIHYFSRSNQSWLPVRGRHQGCRQSLKPYCREPEKIRVVRVNMILAVHTTQKIMGQFCFHTSTLGL